MLTVYLTRYRQRLRPLVVLRDVCALRSFVFTYFYLFLPIIDNTFNIKYIVCQRICLTKCMSTKMGRPRLPKSKAKGVLIGARFSPPEAKAVEAAVRRAKAVKSQWVRMCLLSAAAT